MCVPAIGTDNHLGRQGPGEWNVALKEDSSKGLTLGRDISAGRDCLLETEITCLRNCMLSCLAYFPRKEMKGRKVRHQAKRVNLCLRAFGDRNIRVGSWIGAISISCFWSRKTEWRAGLAAFSPSWTSSPGPSSSKIPGLDQLWGGGPLTMGNLCFPPPLSILILQWRWAAKPFPQGNSPLDNS